MFYRDVIFIGGFFNTNNNNNYKNQSITTSKAKVMGAFLDKPKTEKTNSRGEGAGLRYGVTAMQGWRVDMEDAHAEKIGITEVLKEWSYFAVFDGHAGMKVAQYCAQNLLQEILDTAEFQELVEKLQKNAGKMTEKIADLVRKGIRSGFLKLDDRMKEQPEVYGENERSGTTAICSIISPKYIFVANLGDSRAIMSKEGQWTFSSEDHKPFLPKERERIVNAGGSVMIQRVNGSLAVSRALGDYEYKSVQGLPVTEQLVSPEPDVYCIERENSKDEFLMLACDGVFDVMSNAELCDFVRSRLLVTEDLATVGNQILDSCLSKGSRDNMSVVLVAFPAAPTVSTAAQQAEQELYSQLEHRIQGVVSLCDKISEVETEYVLRILINQEIPGIPPGAGLHAVRSQVDEILDRIKANAANSEVKVDNKSSKSLSPAAKAGKTTCCESIPPSQPAGAIAVTAVSSADQKKPAPTPKEASSAS